MGSDRDDEEWAHGAEEAQNSSGPPITKPGQGGHFVGRSPLGHQQLGHILEPGWGRGPIVVGMKIGLAGPQFGPQGPTLP